MRLNIATIPAHRGFADALVAGLMARQRDPDLGLARMLVLLPSRRAVQSLTEAFVRASGGALILPRLAVIGDLGEAAEGWAGLDPLEGDAGCAPAVDPVLRALLLARIVRAERVAEAPDAVPGLAALLREALRIAETIDRLAVEEVTLDRLLDPAVIGLAGDLAQHWIDGTRRFARVALRWQAELGARGLVDPPVRQGHLLRALAARWRAEPPAHAVVAAGITSAAPAVALLLRTIAGLPEGMVVLPDCDRALDQAVWDALGHAGAPDEAGMVFGRGDIATHPQYHLKLLLNRMGVARDEVAAWHRAGPSAAPPQRSRAISNLFLPPAASAIWAELPAEARSLAGVRLMACAHPDHEARAIAVMVRQALAVPERRVAVITPDRALAQRVIGHLARWQILADDSAGQPLSQTPAGRLMLHLADCAATRAAPVALVALLGHPLVRAGDGRAEWLDQVRRLDLALRGPRPAPGTAGVSAHLANAEHPDRGLIAWWQGVVPLLAPIADAVAPADVGAMLDTLVAAAEALCGDAVWAGADGRALAALVDSWRAAADAAGADPVGAAPAEWLPALRDAFDRVAVRPPWGGHPRLAIYGLIEARMTRADLVICGGLVEGVWPAAGGTDPVLAPAVLRALGIAGDDFRVGLAAHDLAAALGAPEVVLSYAARDVAAPTVPSRFVLRIRAMLGQQLQHEHDAPVWADMLDHAAPVPPHPRPQPRPSAAQREVAIAATALDRLRGDPYQFYASAILRLQALDPLDADLTPAWRGTAVHGVLEHWHRAGAPAGALVPLARERLAQLSAHPLMRALWQPRLIEALAWVEAHHHALAAAGRRVAAFEQWGTLTHKGITIKARADRIDRLPDGSLAVVDYKTGSPPRPRMVEKGFALQLGVIGLIAACNGFAGVAGDPTRFEYWSLARRRDGSGFGWSEEPILEKPRKSGVLREEMLEKTRSYLNDALDRWILGDEPFTARLNPDLPGYSDYDQLMRLDEWQGRDAS